MTGDQSTTLPFVSVIIPVYNDPSGIHQCLDALGQQTYPESQFEVIVVDNGSTDETPEVVKEFPVELCFEREVQGSYAARNTGIRQAKGEILAFLDADCKPMADWLENGVATLQNDEANIAAGRVKMTMSAESSRAERYDAKVNMRNDKNVLEGIAKTANVFVERSVFDEFGLFPESLISGGDVYWSQSVEAAGYDLVYAEEAVVSHPARKLRSFLKKMGRVGRGNVQMWRLEGKPVFWTLLLGLVNFPLKILVFITGSDEPGEDDPHEVPPDRAIEMTLGMYFVAVLAVFAQNAGRIYELYRGLRE